MHEYYSTNKDRFLKELADYISPVADEIEKDTGIPFSTILDETKECYVKDFLENFPYIGGDRASGTKNLTGAYAFVALGVVLRRHGMEIERWGYLATKAYEATFSKIPGFLKKLMKRLVKHPDLIRRMLRKKDGKNRRNNAENPGSFVTETPDPTPDGHIVYNTLQCPLHLFAEKYGYTEYLPYICNLDYVMFGALGLPFRRWNTCSDGDGKCDFTFVPGEESVPAWPCHILDPDDPLK